MTKYSEYEKNLVATVEKHGWYCTGVFDPDGEESDFSYSTGFATTLNAPEFIVFGLDTSLMHAMLWEVFRQIQAGAIPHDGKRWQNVLDGYDCISRKVQAPNVHDEYTVSAQWYWNDTGHKDPLEVYQLVWPGAAQNLFPWDKGCAQTVIDCQPPLWLT